MPGTQAQASKTKAPCKAPSENGIDLKRLSKVRAPAKPRRYEDIDVTNR